MFPINTLPSDLMRTFSLNESSLVPNTISVFFNPDLTAPILADETTLSTAVILNLAGPPPEVTSIST